MRLGDNRDSEQREQQMTNGKIGRRIGRPSGVESGDLANTPSTPNFASNYPNLWKFLAQERASDNYHKTGCMTVFWENGVYKVCLNDRPGKRSTFVSSSGLGEAFQIADRGLHSGTLRWREKGYKQPQQRGLNMRIG